jgi:CO/xanthine dehydrogenase FAD-binding subunit
MMENNFYSPNSIEELVKVLEVKKNSDNMFFVAGATDLAVVMNNNKMFDYTSVDLTKVKEMRNIEKKGSIIEIGACVTMDELDKSDVVRKYIHGLSQAAASVGSTQIRNRATVGGNAANAAQCADTLSALFAYNAIAVIVNSNGEFRETRLEDLIVGFGKTFIEDNEALVKFKVEVKENEYSAFSKVGSRKTVTISKINNCLRVIMDGNKVVECSSYFGSVAAKPVESKLTEEAILGKEINDKLLHELMELGSKQIDEAIPTRSSRHYKRVAVKGIINDVYDEIKNTMEVK